MYSGWKYATDTTKNVTDLINDHTRILKVILSASCAQIVIQNCIAAAFFWRLSSLIRRQCYFCFSIDNSNVFSSKQLILHHHILKDTTLRCNIYTKRKQTSTATMFLEEPRQVGIVGVGRAGKSQALGLKGEQVKA